MSINNNFDKLDDALIAFPILKKTMTSGLIYDQELDFGNRHYMEDINKFSKVTEAAKSQLVRAINEARLPKELNEEREKVLQKVKKVRKQINNILAKDEGAEWINKIVERCKTQCTDFVSKIKQLKENLATLSA